MQIFVMRRRHSHLDRSLYNMRSQRRPETLRESADSLAPFARTIPQLSNAGVCRGSYNGVRPRDTFLITPSLRGGDGYSSDSTQYDD